MTNLVLIVSDENYDHYAKNLIRSIHASNSIDVVHVCLKENLARRTSFVLNHEQKLHRIEIPHFSGTEEQKRVYSAVCRCTLARELLEANPTIKSLIYIDADSIVRRQLDPLIQTFLASNSSVGLRVRNDSHPYLSGVLFLSQVSKPFLDEIILALSTADLVWGQDQTALEHVLSHHPQFQVLALDPKSVGWELCRSLHIYSAKGIDRRKSPEFMLESWALPLLVHIPKKLRRVLRSALFSISGLLHKLKIREHYYFFRSKTLKFVGYLIGLSKN